MQGCASFQGVFDLLHSGWDLCFVGQLLQEKTLTHAWFRACLKAGDMGSDTEDQKGSTFNKLQM